MKHTHWSRTNIADTLLPCIAAIAGVLAGLIAVPPVTAQPAPPLLELVAVTPTVTVNNAIFSETEATIDVTVGHSGGPTAYFVTVSAGSEGTFDPRRMVQRFFFGIFASYLDYNIFTRQGAIARDLSRPLSPREVIRGNFGNTGSGYATASESFTVRVPADQFVRRGTYRDEVVVTLYQGTVNRPAEALHRGEQVVSLTSETPTVAQITVAGQGQDTMNFGVLRTGAVRETELQFRTNAAYRIDATSENQGALRNVLQPSGAVIPYQLSAGGAVIALDSPALVTLGLTVAGSSTSWEVIPLTVTIGSVDDADPGLFQDVITFTISNF